MLLFNLAAQESNIQHDKMNANDFPTKQSQKSCNNSYGSSNLRQYCSLDQLQACYPDLHCSTFQSFLLGVFPIWFGWSGLAGCMIGAFIGGVYVEQVAPYAAWVESVTALIIFSLNWILMPRNATENKSKRNLILLPSCIRHFSFHWNCLHTLAIHLSFQHRDYGLQHPWRIFLHSCSASNLRAQFGYSICSMPCLIAIRYTQIEKLGRLLRQLYGMETDQSQNPSKATIKPLISTY